MDTTIYLNSMLKPEYIVKLESNGDIFSEILFPDTKGLHGFFKSKKIVKIYEKSIILLDGNLHPKNILYKTSQGFFINLNDLENDNWSMTIYYKSEQENEMLLFSKNLLKQLKNATTNNE